MKALFKPQVPERDEREIRILSDQIGVPLVQVRTLFRDELRRVGIGAKVGSYLAVLTSSSVRGMLRRGALMAGAVQPVQERNAARAERQHLQRWEDDGGRARRAQ